MCEIIETLWRLTVLAGLKPKISFCYFEFFLSLFKKISAYALEVSTIATVCHREPRYKIGFQSHVSLNAMNQLGAKKSYICSNFNV